MTETLSSLLLATFLFGAIHIIPSSFLRQKIVGKIGTLPYLGVFSLLSLAAFVWMVMAYIDAPYGAMLWDLGGWTRYVAIVGMAFASILFIGAYTNRSPTGIGGESTVNKPAAKAGLNAITRHPLMWAITIWSSVHLLNNGDVKSVIFFVGLGGVALIGTVMIDKKRAIQLGDDWSNYAKGTSNIPFLAIIQGRSKLTLKAIWWRVLVGLFVFMAFFHLHLKVIGVSPFPI
ncbi:MAG: NnrU family protein [Pseudomonas marincola]